MERLDSLRSFVAVAEHASFSGAARALRISPTAVSRAVASLEKELGVALFRRTTRVVSLTPEGAAYHERCRHALAELDDAARSLRGENAEPRGLLVVTAPVVFGRLRILPIVTEMLRAHPALRIRLTLSDRLVRLADEGVDVAVRIADLSDSSLRAVRVAETRRVLVASPGYLARRGTPAEAADLRRHELIAFDTFAAHGEWRFDGPGHPVIRFEPRLLTDSVEAAIDAAAEGLGVTRALCYQVKRRVAEGTLQWVLPQHDTPGVPISLLFQTNRQRAPNVRAFIEATKTALKDLAPT